MMHCGTRMEEERSAAGLCGNPQCGNPASRGKHRLRLLLEVDQEAADVFCSLECWHAQRVFTRSSLALPQGRDKDAILVWERGPEKKENPKPSNKSKEEEPKKRMSRFKEERREANQRGQDPLEDLLDIAAAGFQRPEEEQVDLVEFEFDIDGIREARDRMVLSPFAELLSFVHCWTRMEPDGSKQDRDALHDPDQEEPENYSDEVIANIQLFIHEALMGVDLGHMDCVEICREICQVLDGVFVRCPSGTLKKNQWHLLCLVLAEM